MRYFIIMAVIFATHSRVSGQFTLPQFLPSIACHINVNERSDQNFRNDIKRAVFRFDTPGCGNCTGTLVNRNTGQTQLGNYFIASWHCFKTGDGNCNGSDFDFTQRITFRFNYQSPDQNSHVFNANVSGDVYSIDRMVRLVDKFSCAYGDFALCEILEDPIPVYFNVYYAGWTPNALNVNLSGPFATIHHPGGSIKKISGANGISGTPPVKSACSSVTKAIDFIFGWLWGRTWSTQVICAYPSIPYAGTKYRVVYNYGKDERGSSGAGLFNGNNRLAGTLSASVPSHSCAFIDPGITFFGKLADSYYRQTVKNTLNPPNKYWIDQTGIPGRQITCYPNITIAHTTGLELPLYSANLYQQENNLTFTAQNTFQTTGNVRIVANSDYVFEAGNNIILGPGFNVDAGAAFTARITTTPCAIPNGRIANPNEGYGVPAINDVLDTMPYPTEKKFDINKYTSNEKQVNADYSIKVFPNPSRDEFIVQKFYTSSQKKIIISIHDFQGRIIQSRQLENVYFLRERFYLPNVASGLYSVKVNNGLSVISEKIMVSK